MRKKSAKAIKAARIAGLVKAREAKLAKRQETDARLSAEKQASAAPLRIAVVERNQEFWDGRRQGHRQGYEQALLDAQAALTEAQKRLLNLAFGSAERS